MVSRISVQQQNYLQRFASQIALGNLTGKPFSLAYLQNRAAQYGGAGWAAWFRGNEVGEARGDGYVIKYIAKDDVRTCGPCHEAQVNGPYLSGSSNIPYPGERCLGHGLCRCRHDIVFDMAKWQELKGNVSI